MYSINQKLTIQFINDFIIDIIIYVSFIFSEEQLKISLEEYYTKAKFEEIDFNLYFQLVANKEVIAQITERTILLDEAKNDFTRLLKSNEKHQNSILYSHSFNCASSNITFPSHNLSHYIRPFLTKDSFYMEIYLLQ